MVFSSIVFLFYLLPATLVLYYTIGRLAGWLRNGVLLAASLIFYAWGEPRYILLLAVSCFLNWGFALLVGPERRSRRFWLAAACTMNLGILFVFKYWDFTMGSINALETARRNGATVLFASSGDIYGGMMQGFAQAFGDALTEMPTGKASEIAFGTTPVWAGVSFEFRRGASSDFPGASILIGGKVYYTHWTPAKAHVSHLQVSSPAAIDAEIAEAKNSLASGADWFIGGHGGATRRDAVEFKIAYLQQMKELLHANATAQ